MTEYAPYTLELQPTRILSLTLASTVHLSDWQRLVLSNH